MRREHAVFGLTGNMGCGKTTVARMLGEARDVAVIDTDEVVKDLLGPSAREAARAAFSDCRMRAALEADLVPRVFREIDRRLNGAGDVAYAVVESALLYEVGVESAFDGVIVVTCGEREQGRRILARGRHTRGEMEARLARQWPGQEKARRARWTIDASGSLEETRRKVSILDGRLRSEVAHAV